MSQTVYEVETRESVYRRVMPVSYATEACIAEALKLAEAHDYCVVRFAECWEDLADLYYMRLVHCEHDGVKETDRLYDNTPLSLREISWSQVGAYLDEKRK